MSWPALVLTPEVTVGMAVQIIQEQQIHHLLVATHGDLLGIVCACDLHDKPTRAPVGRYVSRQVITIEPDATLREAVQRMDEHAINALPSWWRGAWGILTRGDLVREGACARRVCAGCATTHHVRRHPLHRDQWFCTECQGKPLDTVERLYLDLGGSG